jgi:hypothetical protein
MSVPSGFINRAEEIGQITVLLDSLDRPPLAGPPDAYLPHCVVNLHGPPGIGKSALLNELRARLGSRSVTLLIDLRSGLPEDRLLREKLRFVEEGLRALRGVSRPDELHELEERVGAAGQTQRDETVDLALATLLGAVARRAEQQVILLLIDSCEHASEALFAWVERFFLLPLIHDPGGRPSRAVCVFASQIQLRWRQHNVRRRVRAERLGPLSLDATQEQAGDDRLGDALYQLTFGHALSNSVAITYLQAQGEGHADQLSWLQSHQQELIDRVMGELRQHATASMLAGATLPEGWESWDLWALIKPLAVLREFDVNSMRVVLERYHENFHSLNQSALLVAIRELLKTRLVEWNGVLRAYQIAPAIRQIFARALALGHPETYAALRRAATQYYEGQVRTVPANRNLYLTEYLFQQLANPELTPEAARTLDVQLTRFLAQYYANAGRTYLDNEGLDALERSLDADEELKQALEQQGCPAGMLGDAVRAFRAVASADRPVARFS